MGIRHNAKWVISQPFELMLNNPEWGLNNLSDYLAHQIVGCIDHRTGKPIEYLSAWCIVREKARLQWEAGEKHNLRWFMY